MNITIGKSKEPLDRGAERTVLATIEYCRKCKDGTVWMSGDVASAIGYNYTTIKAIGHCPALDSYRVKYSHNGTLKWFYGNAKTIAAIKEQQKREANED